MKEPIKRMYIRLLKEGMPAAGMDGFMHNCLCHIEADAGYDEPVCALIELQPWQRR